MKKIFISLFLSGVFMYHTNAQTAVEGNKFLDNWSIGISAGGTTPLTHHSFFGNMRPITGIELNKQLTPVFGFGLRRSEALTPHKAGPFSTAPMSVCWGW